MDAILKKLNYKGQAIVFAINAPHSFQENLDSIADTATIKTGVNANDKVVFAIIFVTKLAEIEQYISTIGPKLEGDAVLWMCYPKGTSKKYKCDFNRDNGWAALGQYGLEPVRMVAIDGDWSALRFRKVEHIQKLTRTFGAISDEGKKRIQ